MIKLGNERKLRLESHAARERTQEHTILQASEGDAARFLPIEYYLVDNETP